MCVQQEDRSYSCGASYLDRLVRIVCACLVVGGQVELRKYGATSAEVQDREVNLRSHLCDGRGDAPICGPPKLGRAQGQRCKSLKGGEHSLEGGKSNTDDEKLDQARRRFDRILAAHARGLVTEGRQDENVMIRECLPDRCAERARDVDQHQRQQSWSFQAMLTGCAIVFELIRRI